MIIKESLPANVRAQKETLDLLCFLANAFIDLLSDVANNMCYKQKKKNIVNEHVLRALQEMHLDEFLPHLLYDDQTMKLSDILKVEKKVQDGIALTSKQITNEDRNQSNRDSMVNQMLKRLSDSVVLGERKKKRVSCKLLLQGQSAAELEE